MAISLSITLKKPIPLAQEPASALKGRDHREPHLLASLLKIDEARIGPLQRRLTDKDFRALNKKAQQLIERLKEIEQRIRILQDMIRKLPIKVPRIFVPPTNHRSTGR